MKKQPNQRLLFSKEKLKQRGVNFMNRKLPNRFYYQLNGKSPMENYIEQKKKRREEKIGQNNQQKSIEKAIDKEVHKQLDKYFSKF